MLESLVSAFQGLVTAARAMASFDALRKGRKGDVRALIDELRENSRLCFRVVSDGVDHRAVIPRFSTAAFDRLNHAGFDFDTLQPRRIERLPGLAATDLAAWPGKRTSELIENIYEKIKELRSLHEFRPDGAFNRRRLINIHKRILLLLRHAGG